MDKPQPNAPAYLDGEHCVRTLGNLVVTLSDAPPNPGYLAAWTAEMDRVVQAHEKVLNCIVISGLATVPTEESRQKIREAVIRHREVIVGAAFVVESTGFLAAAMRSAVSLTGLLARYPFPQKTFGNTTEAGTWLGELDSGPAGHVISASSLRALLRVMRTELDAASAEPVPASSL